MTQDYNYKTTIKVANDDGTWSTLGSCLNDFKVELDPLRYESEILGIWNEDDAICDTIQCVVDKQDQRISALEELIKGRNDNMNIVELYERRMKEKIRDDYKKFADADYDNFDVVREYNELINTFKINMEQLAEKYNTNNETYLVRTGYRNDYVYELSCNIREEIDKKYADQFEAEMRDVERLVEEVRAALSLSDDKDYQLEVLKNYEIIDKKGRLTV